MGESSSRRSFLFGRQATAHDNWSKFVVALRHACQGNVRLVAERQARLDPAKLDDVIKARELCQTHAVVMALEGVPLPSADQSRFVLWVQAGSAWGSLIPLGSTGLWRVDAGCPVAGMQAAGLIQLPPDSNLTNLAQWFASAYRGQPLAGSSLRNQIVSVDWLLPDGTIEVFGAFGAEDAQPLGSLAAQRLVPKLFELALGSELQQALAQAQWPSMFHLDALVDVKQVNLAHFFLGHAGSLGWLVAATFRHSTEPVPTVSCEPVALAFMSAIDQQTKAIVDPEQVFLSFAGQTR